MAKPSKTVKIEKLLERVNNALAAPDSTPDGREALCAVLESVLLDANQYAGFSYLTTDEALGAGSRRRYMMKER